MPRAVITGGAGFLGSHLCRRLLAEGFEVVCLDSLLTGQASNVEDLQGERFHLVKVDVTNYIHVSGPVDAVLHFASPASPIDYLRYPIQTLKVGALGTHHALGLAKDKGARFLLASTSEVYGDPQVHPQPESYWGHVNPIGPRGVYDEAKRFAEAMSMAYHRTHGLPVRIARIFNSILADEQVLYDDGVELRREPVEVLARRLGGQVDLDGYRVPAFDRDGKVVAAEASALLGHPTEAKCYQVHTRYGRSIRVTGDHSLFVKGSDGLPRPCPVSRLRADDKIAIASVVRVPERDRAQVDMVEVWDQGGNDPWNLMIHGAGLGAVAWERRFELFAAIAKRNPRTAPRWRCHVWGEIANHRKRDQLPLGALRALGIAIPSQAWVRLRTKGRSAVLPRFVELTDEVLWLLGLYVAEGCRSEGPKSAFIVLTCDEATLDRAAKILQRDLNLHVVRTRASSTRTGAIFTHARLLLLILDHLGFSAGPKRLPGWVLGLPLARLKWVLEGYREGDGVHSGKKFEEGIRHEFSTTSTELKDDLVVAFGRFGLLPSVGRYRSTFRQRTGDRRYPFWRLTLANVHPWSPLDWDRGVRQRINARRSGDLVWAAVTRIEEIPATRLVYDFSVPGHENFWAGSGIMAKNTFGPYMRVDDGRAFCTFAVQALRGEPLTVHGDGSQTRSLCYVDDLVEGLWRLLWSDTPGPINIGNPEEIPVLELAKQIARAAGGEPEIVFQPRPVDDPEMRRPDITVARKQLGWKPQVSLADGIRRTLPWFQRALGLGASDLGSVERSR
jgi:nucleoside-diphosphate-sugar epimerase/intein/homing endonuclease